MKNKLSLETINKIADVIDRAYAMGIAGLYGDTRFDHFMDMEIACRYFDDRLDLDFLMTFDDFSFAHDFLGIRQRVDRPHCTFVNDCFLPRCCR